MNKYLKWNNENENSLDLKKKKTNGKNILKVMMKLWQDLNSKRKKEHGGLIYAL